MMCLMMLDLLKFEGKKRFDGTEVHYNCSMNHKKMKADFCQQKSDSFH